MRLTAAAQRKTPRRTDAQAASTPASIGGWNTISSIADMDPKDAVQLDNFIPRPGWLEPRRGFEVWSDGMGSSEPVESIMSYYGITQNKLFTAAGSTIWDATAGGTAVATTVTALSSPRLQYCNFTNTAGSPHFLVACNGIDAPPVYDGTNWSTLSLTGATVSTFIQPHVHQGRLWFVAVNSSIAYYCALGAITGVATPFNLGPFIGQGGYLMAIASWTVDTRQTVSDYIAFISSRGQVIVYAGIDPADPDNWSLVGVYNLGPPIGRRCFFKLTGDLAIITLDGVVSMNTMLSTDRLAANRNSPFVKIQPSINDAVAAYGQNFGWQLIGYPKGSLAILNVPVAENNSSLQFVMNTITGASCRFLGINANVWEIYNEDIYFGGNAGELYQWDITSGDGDTPITCNVGTAFNYFESRGILKRWTMIRPILTTDGSVTPGIGMNVDFGTGGMISQASTVQQPSALWDVAVWDDAKWPQLSATIANWEAVVGLGQCASILTQVVTADNGAADGVTLRLNGWDLTYEAGGFV